MRVATTVKSGQINTVLARVRPTHRALEQNNYILPLTVFSQASKYTQKKLVHLEHRYQLLHVHVEGALARETTVCTCT